VWLCICVAHVDSADQCDNCDDKRDTGRQRRGVGAVGEAADTEDHRYVEVEDTEKAQEASEEVWHLDVQYWSKAKNDLHGGHHDLRDGVDLQVFDRVQPSFA
jgi:hypothetical protein